MEIAHAIAFDAYKCKVCGGWHIGRRSDAQQRHRRGNGAGNVFTPTR